VGLARTQIVGSLRRGAGCAGRGRVVRAGRGFGTKCYYGEESSAFLRGGRRSIFELRAAHQQDLFHERLDEYFGRELFDCVVLIFPSRPGVKGDLSPAQGNPREYERPFRIFLGFLLGVGKVLKSRFKKGVYCVFDAPNSFCLCR
jgi:hypothetical protein